MGLGIVNESSNAKFGITFKDENGDPAVPTAATWEIIDDASGQVMMAEVAISPLQAQVLITIPDTANDIIDDTRMEENRVVIVRATFVGGSKLNAQCEYSVKNLRRVI
jgi:hypothetical protein